MLFTKEFSSPTGKNLVEIPVDEANLEMPENGIFVAIKKKDSEGDPNYSDEAGIVRLTKVYDKNVSFFHCRNQWFETDHRNLDYRLV